MGEQVIFSPLIDLRVIIVLAAVFAGLLYWAAIRNLPGWGLRALSALVLLLAIANPSLQNEQRDPLSDIVLLLVDESASQTVSDRSEQTAQAVARIEAEIAALDNTELRVIPVGDGPDNSGTLMMQALNQALASEPRGRIAGIIAVSDGRVHDVDQGPELPAPLQVLLTGHASDWDRRLIVKNAPSFAIMDEEFEIILRIEEQGRVPQGGRGTVTLTLTHDGESQVDFDVPVGQDLSIPVQLPHGGRNVIQLSIPGEDGELTARNNAAVLEINGVRDRLRVLLVSGEPHPGERTWRNLLKSDSAVDLVHFTILRPPEKQDGVPVTELSLIAFPTNELFMQKIDEFDLIIFDRYRRRGILPMLYLDNVRRYVEDGGAVLVAAGPDYASASSIFRSPLSEILPGEPTGRVIEEGFRPEVTELGHKHPVTQGLEKEHGAGAESALEDAPWGRWFRHIDVQPHDAQEVMTGFEGRPMLILDRVGEGRVALLASDHAWLWNRGFEGGGPQLELLRRLAHWMMKEPELEEEALTASASGQAMTVTRRTLGDAPQEFTIEAPDGTVLTVSPEEAEPGRYQAQITGDQMGVYKITDGKMQTVAALGPSAPKEFEQTIATAEVLDPLVDTMRGGILPIEAGLPDIRTVGAGRPAAGRGWIGITPREAYNTTGAIIRPVLPVWAYVMLALLLVIGAWLWEGRRKGPPVSGA
ncbi:hypothetical protein [Qingshengfaniella alkalisoli]|uniref:Glutamine amidotransferase domain-containing protein n=1 Tax=Qingshengfaniella alkalisoli TaxID=2599296 RepID=A0A5B8IZE0_9RHOB|nr:hypothetical protein [Qingshengfaniella alkalisoli]QDY70301.1 hypothetical protein FPZ52_08875 [Qingshengfaniella alkalisoli]